MMNAGKTWFRKNTGLPGLMVPLMLGTFGWAGLVQAAGDLPAIESSAFSFQGFGTLGAARSNNGDAHVLRSIRHPQGISTHWSVKQDSLLGLQTQYNFNDQVSALIQAASYYREDGSFEPDVTAAFLKFDLTPRFTVRLGRVGLDLLMLNDTRMVGYSYMPIRPVSESYNVPANYVDGLNARWRFPVGEGIVSLDGSGGIAREDLPRYKFSGSRLAKGSIGYEQGVWQFRYFYARAKLAHESSDPNLRQLLQGLNQAAVYVPPIASQATGLAHKLLLKDTSVVYESLGAGYDDGLWQAQAVLDVMRYENPIMVNGKAFHFLLGRRVGDVTPYVGYSRARTKSKHVERLPNLLPPGSPLYPMFQQLNAGLDSVLGATIRSLDNETYTLGARWDFRRNMALKAQLDYLRGGKSVAPFVTNTDRDWNGKATMISVSLDFVF